MNFHALRNKYVHVDQSFHWISYDFVDVQLRCGVNSKQAEIATHKSSIYVKRKKQVK